MVQTEMRRSLLLLLAGLLLAGGVLFLSARQIYMVGHDDVISLIAATCHQEDYVETSPSGQWASAGEWQRYWQLDELGCFTEIGRGLALYDIHPPLYFWLLHVWMMLTSVDFIAALMFNIFPHLATALIIFASCHLLGCRPYASATAGFLWLIARPTLTVPLIIRQYSLLALIAAWLLLALLLYTRRSDLKTGFFVCLAMLGGLLTQYTFVLLLLISVGCWSILFLYRRQGYRLVGLAIGSAGAFGTLFLLHPLLMYSVQRQQEQRQAFILAEVPLRIKLFVASIVNFLFPVSVLENINDRVPGMKVGLLLIGGVATVSILLRSRHYAVYRIRQFRLSINWLPVVVSAALLSILFVTYVLHITPRHAVGERYLTLVTPWLFVALGQLLHQVTRWMRWWPIVFSALIAYQLIYGISAVGVSTFRWRQFTEPAYVLDEAPLVIDTVHRGVLPRILWYVPEERLVYAAAQPQLLESFPIFQDSMSSLVYIWAGWYESTEEGRQMVLSQFKQQDFQVIAEYPSIHERGVTYILERTE